MRPPPFSAPLFTRAKLRLQVRQTIVTALWSFHPFSRAQSPLGSSVDLVNFFLFFRGFPAPGQERGKKTWVVSERDRAPPCSVIPGWRLTESPPKKFHNAFGHKRPKNPPSHNRETNFATFPNHLEFTDDFHLREKVPEKLETAFGSARIRKKVVQGERKRCGRQGFFSQNWVRTALQRY